MAESRPVLHETSGRESSQILVSGNWSVFADGKGIFFQFPGTFGAILLFPGAFGTGVSAGWTWTSVSETGCTRSVLVRTHYSLTAARGHKSQPCPALCHLSIPFAPHAAFPPLCAAPVVQPPIFLVAGAYDAILPSSCFPRPACRPASHPQTAPGRRSWAACRPPSHPHPPRRLRRRQLFWWSYSFCSGLNCPRMLPPVFS
eukprot:gene15242-biopygen8153